MLQFFMWLFYMLTITYPVPDSRAGGANLL